MCSTSSVSALGSSARLPWSVTCTSRSFRRTTRATRTRLYIANASHACVSDVALLCFRPCVGLNACGAQTGTGRFVAHARVFFTTCPYWFRVHLITSRPYQAHASKHRPLFLVNERVVIHERNVTLVPVHRASDTMPRHTTPLHATPSRAGSRPRNKPHIRTASRT